MGFNSAFKGLSLNKKIKYKGKGRDIFLESFGSLQNAGHLRLGINKFDSMN
jgi:hypothetical protein